MEDIDDLFIEWLSDHLADEENMLYMGPDNGAHLPQFFVKPKDAVKKFELEKKILTTIRTTAALYEEPHRTSASSIKVWAIAADFDIEEETRKAQEATLREFALDLPPTAVVATRHGFHLYWVLEKPESVFDYAWPANLIHSAVGTDPRSLIPVQCLSLRNNDARKKSEMVDSLTFRNFPDEIPAFPHVVNLYTLADLARACQKDISPALSRLIQLKYRSKNSRGTVETDSIREKIHTYTDMVKEKVNVLRLLRLGGVNCYQRGEKIIMACPYHDDKHPSAWLDLNPSSQWYGWMFCCSTRCGKKATLRMLLRDLGLEDTF